MNDVVINKIQSMQRCVVRVREERDLAGGDLASSITHQDAAVLNITRACELAIDLANHLIKVRQLGIPNDSRESFEFLKDAELITPDLTDQLKSMVGFRNVAVHDYVKLDIQIVSWIIEEGLEHLLSFADEIRQIAG